MDKIELEIVALSHSITQSHSYAVVLGEKLGVRRLPIVIGGAEAQAIAIALENMDHGRPLTHDLIKNIFDEFSFTLQEVVINNLKDGIFFAQLVCSNENNDIYTIDSRTSDALALAVRFSCPIYTFEFILEQAGIIMDDTVAENQAEGIEGGDDDDDKVKTITAEAIEKGEVGHLTMDELNKQLDESLKNEHYELAAKLRDEINRRSKGS